MNAQLVVTAGPDQGKVFILPGQQCVSVGRGSAAVIRLSDAAMSRVHFEIDLSATPPTLVTKSDGGLTVNGVAVDRHELRDGDVIRSGKTELRVELTVPDHGEHTPSSEEPATEFGGGRTEEPSPPTLVARLQPPFSMPARYPYLKPPRGVDEIGRLAHYAMHRVLGEGGMGVVFEATDTLLRRRVAVKVIRPQYGEVSKTRQRFLREARTMVALKHEHIINTHHVGEDGSTLYLVMELLSGEPLSERVRREGQLPLAEIVRIVRETALGLAEAHARGIVHRDIKPSNLFLCDEANCVKVLDFGLARAEWEEQLTTAGRAVGTPGWMSPEQAAGEAVDYRSDLFNLGVLLYRLITGRMPFERRGMLETLKALANEDAPPMGVEVPLELAEMVGRLLAKRPEGRLADALAVAEGLVGMEAE